MPLRTLLFVAALVVIAFGLYVLLKVRGSKTTLKIAGFGELSTTSLGLATLVVGVLMACYCVQAELKHQEAERSQQAKQRQAAASAAALPPSVSVSQSSTGDGSPNVGIHNGGSVTVQVDKSKNER